jgi:hypothetical protein
MEQLVLFLFATVTATTSNGQADDLPPVNARVVEFVKERLGEKVDRGECWDLAAAALDHAQAKWDGAYDFGDLVDWRGDTVLPGDIVQFEGVTIHRRTGDQRETLSMGHHTAIIIEVHGRGSFTIAHQNFGREGRRVCLLDFHMADVRAGKVTYHRPRPR